VKCLECNDARTHIHCVCGRKVFCDTCPVCGRMYMTQLSNSTQWKVDRWGSYREILSPDQVIRNKSFFATCSKTVSLVVCMSDDTCCWNTHLTVGEDGEIYRIDLCLAYLESLDKPHPHVFLDDIVNEITIE
jgi:hypothetical protein